MGLSIGNRYLLIFWSDGRQADEVPTFLFQKVAGQILGMQSLHDDNDRASLLVVEPRKERSREPGVHPLATGLGVSLRGAQRIIDNDDVAASARQCSAHGRGKTKPTLLGLDFVLRVLEQGATAKNVPVPVGVQHTAEVRCVLGRKVLRIARANELQRGILAQAIGREGDGTDVRF